MGIITRYGKRLKQNVVLYCRVYATERCSKETDWSWNIRPIQEACHPFLEIDPYTQMIDNIITSMPKRLDLIISNGGQRLRYWTSRDERKRVLQYMWRYTSKHNLVGISKVTLPYWFTIHYDPMWRQCWTNGDNLVCFWLLIHSTTLLFIYI